MRRYESHAQKMKGMNEEDLHAADAPDEEDGRR